MTLLGWLCALLSAGVYGVGSVVQASAAGQESRTPVVRRPLYVAGLACDAVAWLASLVAVRLLPLLVVQAVLCLSVGVTVLLARVVWGTRPRPRDLAAIGVLALTVPALATAFTTVDATRASRGAVVALLLGLAASVVVTVVAYSRTPSVVLALIAGIGFSGTTIAVRLEHPHSLVGVLAQPATLALVGFGVVSTIAYGRALEIGHVGAATAVLWGAETIAAGLAGVLVLGDGVRAGQGWLVAVATLAGLAATAVLATAPAEPVRATGRQPQVSR